ncbi:TPA: hypothetical protein ACV196_004573, partial [Escherichia coli]
SKKPLWISNLSPQPDPILVKKNTLDMFSKTHIKGLGRVDRLTFILLSLVFSRLSQTSVSCYQHNTLNVP